ncbi:MAG: hypothetical protein MUC35_07265 [Candidatus Margulisbacteria bacterium]|nr:hypothetical protein [Candidatus Margulisiibacteriota bacterium]
MLLLVISGCAFARPTLSVKLNGVTAIPGDSLSATPRIEIIATTTTGPVRATLEVGSALTNLTFVQSGNNYYATAEITTALADGIFALTIEAADATTAEAVYELTPLYVRTAGDPAAIGAPLCYPNPFDPGNAATPTAKIGYTLTRSANVTLSIHDLAGTLLVKQSYAAGVNGGSAGYNAVTWDGRSAGGNVAGNGIYVYLLIADGKLVGKGKVTVLKR